MLNFSRCYICSEIIKIKNLYLCDNCFFLIQKQLWENCSRCGVISCEGCSKLAEFENIYCLYGYSCGIPEILVQAKEQSDYNAQLLFSELFSFAIENFFINIFDKNNYDYVVLSSLRKERVLNSSWHPIFLFEKIINCLRKKFSHKYKDIHVVSSLFLEKSNKQAVIPSYIRKYLNNNSDNKKFILRIFLFQLIWITNLKEFY